LAGGGNAFYLPKKTGWARGLYKKWRRVSLKVGQSPTVKLGRRNREKVIRGKGEASRRRLRQRVKFPEKRKK